MEYPVVDLDDSSRDRELERAHWQLHVENRMRLFENYGLLATSGTLRHIDEEKLYHFLIDIKDCISPASPTSESQD